MDNIAQRLKAYTEAHPFEPGESNYDTVLDQRYQAYAESCESDPLEIQASFAELENFLETMPWTITMPSSTAAASASIKNTKPSSTA